MTRQRSNQFISLPTTAVGGSGLDSSRAKHGIQQAIARGISIRFAVARNPPPPPDDRLVIKKYLRMEQLPAELGFVPTDLESTDDRGVSYTVWGTINERPVQGHLNLEDGVRLVFSFPRYDLAFPNLSLIGDPALEKDYNLESFSIYAMQICMRIDHRSNFRVVVTTRGAIEGVVYILVGDARRSRMIAIHRKDFENKLSGIVYVHEDNDPAFMHPGTPKAAEWFRPLFAITVSELIRARHQSVEKVLALNNHQNTRLAT